MPCGHKRAVGPAIDLANFADGAGGDHLGDAAGPVGGARGGGDLRHQAALLDLGGQRANFVDRPRQRLDAADVLVLARCGHADHRVRVVGRAAIDGVELVGVFVEQLAVVAAVRGIRKQVVGLFREGVIDIAQGGDLDAAFFADALDLAVADAADADAGDGNDIAGIGHPGRSDNMPRNKGQPPPLCPTPPKIPAVR